MLLWPAPCAVCSAGAMSGQSICAWGLPALLAWAKSLRGRAGLLAGCVCATDDKLSSATSVWEF